MSLYIILHFFTIESDSTICGNSPNSALVPPTISSTLFELHFSIGTGFGTVFNCKGNAEIVDVNGLEYSSHSMIKINI